MTGSAVVKPAAEARRGHIAMLAFSALVAGSFSLGGQIANEIAPTALNAIRFVIAAAAIWAVVRARGGVPSFAWAAPWRYLILGGFFAVYFVTMFEGLKTAPPVSAAAVFTLTPVMSAGFGWLMLRQGVNPRIVAALGLGAVGALWVIFRADWAAFTAFEVGRGEAIFFWGCVAHAAYTPAVRWLNRGEPVLVFTFLTLSACAGILLVYGAGDILATDWLGLRPLVWVTLIYVALIASSTTVFLVQYASMRLPSAKVMAYTYLTPSWVLLWELALGQPVPPAMVLVGVGLSFGAVALLLKE
ncbi:DMT family transporter [Maritalea mobilis]|uniref:DMT family transporter n=1 Tax=Maritalea mobilis TaxID=483324 RepID=UPI001C941492|nr:DMT family transporter [Maritalea mobilis]MBY6202112.1 DMT family transporter [Maritalea mobilis]